MEITGPHSSPSQVILQYFTYDSTWPPYTTRALLTPLTHNISARSPLQLSYRNNLQYFTYDSTWPPYTTRALLTPLTHNISAESPLQLSYKNNLQYFTFYVSTWPLYGPEQSRNNLAIGSSKRSSWGVDEPPYPIIGIRPNKPENNTGSTHYKRI
jgi:hypothetical protein